MVIVNCEVCGKDIEKYQSQIDYSKSKRFYCSKECRSVYRKREVKREELICKNCGNIFYRTHRDIKNAKSKNREIKYCSKKCMLDDKHVESKTINCTNCNKEITRRITDMYTTNFCNMDCYREYHKRNDMIDLVCKNCNKVFSHKKHYIETQAERGQVVKYCSKDCAVEFMRRDMIEVKCSICNKTYLKNKNKLNKKDELCSFECKKEYIKRNHNRDVVCNQCGKKFTKNKYRYDKAKTHYCSQKCFNEYRTTAKDNYQKLSHYLRSSSEYEKWRKKVFDRDGYTCKECGEANNLHAHHIIELHKICSTYDMNIENILKSKEFNDIDNGITLCPKCHNKRHPFLKRDNKGRFCRLEVRSTEASR